jgi:hypothetical protein
MLSTEGPADVTTSVLPYYNADILHNNYIEFITEIVSVFYIVMYVLKPAFQYLTCVHWFKQFFFVKYPL